jgi:aminoglycoside 6'-N-acetyltransferase
MDERAVRDRFFGPGPVLPAEEFQAFLVERNGRPVGFVQVYRLPPEERELFGDSPDRPAYGVDLFLGEPELWGHGLGPRAIVLAREFLRDHRGAVRVVADPRVNNPRSVRAFEKAGFRKIRVLPARELHEGVRCDCWWMEYP